MLHWYRLILLPLLLLSLFVCLFDFCSALRESLHFIKKASFFASYVIKELDHAFSCEYMELWSTRELRRAFKKLELLSATPWAILTLPSCSPNFRRTSITWHTHSKHEWIFKLRIEKHCLVKHFCFLEKHFGINIKIIVLRVTYCFCKLLTGPQPTLLECIVIFL